MRAGGGRCTETDSHSRQTALQRERSRGRASAAGGQGKRMDAVRQGVTGQGLRGKSFPERIVTIVEVHVG